MTRWALGALATWSVVLTACASGSGSDMTTTTETGQLIVSRAASGPNALDTDLTAAGATECSGCASDAACGAGAGCYLYDLAAGASRCAVDCSARASACPSGTACLLDSSGNGTCVPSAGTCVGFVPTATGTGSGSGGGSGGGGSGGGGSGGGGSGGGPGSATCAALTDTWSNYAAPFFAAHCARCHGWTSNYGNVSQLSATISQYVTYGFMPQGETLPAADRQRLITWIACGLPQ